MIKITEIVTK